MIVGIIWSAVPAGPTHGDAYRREEIKEDEISEEEQRRGEKVEGEEFEDDADQLNVFGSKLLN